MYIEMTLWLPSRFERRQALADDQRNFDHLLIRGYAKSIDFHRLGRGSDSQLRQVDRYTHGTYLKQSAETVFKSSDDKRVTKVLSDSELRATGTVIILEGEGATYPLKLDSLNSYTGGRASKPKWLLLSVREAEAKDGKLEQATVWVSDAYRKQFLKIFEDYLNDDKNTKKGKPKNQALVANISRIREALLDDLWTSESEPSRSGMQWWEIWLDALSPNIDDWQQISYRLSTANYS